MSDQWPSSLHELAKWGQYVVSDRAVKVVHQSVQGPAADVFGPIVCKPPWLCERYADSELWIDATVNVDGDEPTRSLWANARFPADPLGTLLRSLAPYLLGRNERRREQDRAMFLYLPQLMEPCERSELGPPPVAAHVQSVIWLHRLDDFDRFWRDASQLDLSELIESLRTVFGTADGESLVARGSFGPHRADEMVKRRSQVVNEVTEDERDAVRRAFGFIGGDDSVPDSVPLLEVFADQVRLSLPEHLQFRQEVYSMVVRPLDLFPYWGPVQVVGHEEAVGDHVR